MGRCWTWYTSIFGGSMRPLSLSRGEGARFISSHTTKTSHCGALLCYKCTLENAWVGIRGGAECEVDDVAPRNTPATPGSSPSTAPEYDKVFSQTTTTQKTTGL